MSRSSAPRSCRGSLDRPRGRAPAFAVACLALVASCEPAAGPSAQLASNADVPPTAFDPASVRPSAFDAHAVERAVVGTRETHADAVAPIELVLDHETPDLRVLALSDPIGDVSLEVRPGRVELLEDGARVVLYDAAIDAPAPPLPGSGVTADGSEAAAAAGPAPARNVAVADGCARVTLTWTWPPAGPLDATWREDAFTLCAPDGLRGRSRSARFPAGERTSSWAR